MSSFKQEFIIAAYTMIGDPDTVVYGAEADTVEGAFNNALDRAKDEGHGIDEMTAYHCMKLEDSFEGSA